MTQKYSAFSYKQGSSFIHKMPSVCKILGLPVLSILFFNLPLYFSIGLILVQFVLCFVLGFTIKEQLQDFSAVFYYAVLLYFTTFLIQFCPEIENFSREMLLEILKEVFLNKATVEMLLKLFCVIQMASIVFKTSTSLEIRDGIGQIEGFIRKIFHLSKKNKLTNMISQFVCFIPMIFKVWNQLKRAWKIRQGKSGIKMYLALLPSLFSVGIKQAYNNARAMAVRDE